MKNFIFSVLFSLVLTIPAFADDVDTLVKQLASQKTLQADFVQKTVVEGFGEDVYEGSVSIVYQQKALWDYRAPYAQYYLFDTSSVDYYDSVTNQLIRTSTAELEQNPVLQVMLDLSTLKSSFAVTLAGGKVHLEPKTDIGLEYIDLRVNNGVIQEIVSLDYAGNSTTITFSNIRTGKSIPPSVFEKKLPEDVEILNQ